ncbi:SCO family protein [Motilimonas pumila]|uniref:SCO family protein n=1 Tax=Motilimonas pumila TaxID=2303987 RepID=A0A418YHB8_9GAMM|nr:SCO family protein [Motilimonas pumila]RJG49492.1 SCO family protein [Motilimonas pumila]
MKNKASWIFIGLLALIAGVWAAQQFMPTQAEVKATVYDPPKVIEPFELQRGGGSFNNKDLLGKWSLVFIGYTFCPDVCPTTLSDLNRIAPQLAANPAKEPVQVLFVSVDPNRDQAGKLTEYTHYFNPDFIGLTAEHTTLFPFTRQLGMVYSIVEQGTEGYYLVDHSASIALINPEGKLQGVFRPEFEQAFRPEREKGTVPSVDMQQLVKDLAVISKG